MIRDEVVTNVVQWFNDPQWKRFVGGLEPDNVIYHAHIYAESCLDPRTLSKVLQNYFQRIGRPLQRKIKYLGHGNGLTNIYYMQPLGMAHFELFLKHNKTKILDNMPAQYTRSGKVYEYWDREYMEAHYRKYDMKKPGPGEIEKIEEYFNSDSWKHVYAVARDKSVVHSHAVVETNLLPETILPYGRKAIERRGWEVSRAVSVVWDFMGYDQSKLTYLLKSPEVVLELELQYEPFETMRPGPVPVFDIVTEADLEKTMRGLEYISLTDEEIEAINRLIRL